MTNVRAVSAAQLFRTEIAEARRLGYRVQTNVTDQAAAVRLVATSPRAQHIARRHRGTAIESVVPFEKPSEAAEALHSALTACLMHARDCAA